MITAQDIREKTFEKSKFGGYDMAQVDEFLEELADDLTNSQKEVAVLKSKMKVLVDKIEEYRNNESALNKSILSAQKLAQEIETEARDKAAKVLADAEKKADETVGSITARAEFEEKEEPAPAAEVYEDASADLDLPESSAPDFADGEVDATQAFTL